jgi:hypothetical protein
MWSVHGKSKLGGCIGDIGKIMIETAAACCSPTVIRVRLIRANSVLFLEVLHIATWRLHRAVAA